MSDHDAHVPDPHGSAHEVAGAHGSTAYHGDGHGHDDHGHGGDTLGPADWTMWTVGVVGVVIAILVTAAFFLATSSTFIG